MSTSLNVATVETTVPIIDKHLEAEAVAVVQPSQTMIYRLQSSSHSDTTVNWTLQPPLGTTSYIDRCWLMQAQVTINVAGTPKAGNVGSILADGFYALRSYPLSSVISSVQVTLNNQQFSWTTSQYIQGLNRFWSQQQESTYPDMTDTYGTYPADTNHSSVINNPLGSYGNVVGGLMPRGSFPMTITNSQTAGQIVATITEPIYCPVLASKYETGLGFTGVQSLAVQITWSPNLTRMLSAVFPNTNGVTVTATFGTSAPSILFRFVSPAIGDVPRPLQYPAPDFKYFTTACSVAPCLAGASSQVVSTNMQITCIPNFITLYIREADANQTYSSADWALNITGVSILFDGQSGQLSSADETTLYQITRSNGCKDNWSEYHGQVNDPAPPPPATSAFIGTSGSFLRLSVAKDLMLAPGHFVGQMTQQNMQITVNYTNNNTISMVTPMLYVITETTQFWTITPEGATSSTLGVSETPSGSGGGVSGYVPYSDVIASRGSGIGDWHTRVLSSVRPMGAGIRQHAAGRAGAVRRVGYGGAIQDPEELRRRMGRL